MNIRLSILWQKKERSKILKLQCQEHFGLFLLEIIPTGDKNIIYVEGQGIITTKDGDGTAIFRGYGIGTSKGQVDASFRGSVFYKSSLISTNGKLAFLNNKIGIFESEVDESSTSNEKHWEWK